jgi:hypothetical protein
MWIRLLGPFVSDTHSFAAVCRCYCFVAHPTRHRRSRRQLRRLYLFWVDCGSDVANIFEIHSLPHMSAWNITVGSVRGAKNAVFEWVALLLLIPCLSSVPKTFKEWDFLWFSLVSPCEKKNDAPDWPKNYFPHQGCQFCECGTAVSRKWLPTFWKVVSSLSRRVQGIWKMNFFVIFVSDA